MSHLAGAHCQIKIQAIKEACTTPATPEKGWAPPETKEQTEKTNRKTMGKIKKKTNRKSIGKSKKTIGKSIKKSIGKSKKSKRDY